MGNKPGGIMAQWENVRWENSRVRKQEEGKWLGGKMTLGKWGGFVRNLTLTPVLNLIINQRTLLCGYGQQ